MGISAAELAVHRANTVAFIAADSFACVLNRKTKVADGAGGYTLGSAPVAAQIMRLIPLGDGAPERLTEDGKSVRPSYMLMGRWDCDIERWDTFSKDGRNYRIVYLNENRQYETKGEAVYVG
jgi:hypothetical protein